MSDWEEESDSWQQENADARWSPRETSSWRNDGKGRANRFGGQQQGDSKPWQTRPRGFGRGRGFGQKDSEWRSSGSSWRDRDQNGDVPRRFDCNGGYNDRGRSCETMMVPYNEVGRIIGKGGQKIREIQSSSGASIKVYVTHYNCFWHQVFALDTHGPFACDITPRDCMTGVILEDNSVTSDA